MNSNKNFCSLVKELNFVGILLHSALIWLSSPHHNHLLDGAGIHNEKFERRVNKTLLNGQGYQGCDSNKQNGSDDAKVAANPKQKIMLHQLNPPALQVLHELVSLVHDNVNGAAQNQPVLSTSTDNSVVSTKGGSTKIVSLNSCRLEDDPVAYAFWTLKPLELQNVLLSMARNFPRTLEALIVHVLSPVGAEVLTRKFEEIDKMIPKEERDEFYQILYGVFDDQFKAMDSILNGKESFALQAFRNVLDKYLGVNFDGP
ncbi:2-oxoglutarate (2OG) and Fe(II)-dependent oxygenase superfamily protein [Thalictrum thalictroides]|uniref:2-oxoglutarate (2OG) and Fe(II)-dependent oxygenase superfamily protein n=1 Tax=Thalictrum thalictroides TaxID=46969 RepID=A0A7J6X9W6_THATH|nr:2-oxoglutarate (2OG) and Fe(II)-dependent oxygenase superfamily protein [Thalictrum thalictroides]